MLAETRLDYANQLLLIIGAKVWRSTADQSELLSRKFHKWKALVFLSKVHQTLISIHHHDELSCLLPLLLQQWLLPLFHLNIIPLRQRPYWPPKRPRFLVFKVKGLAEWCWISMIPSIETGQNRGQRTFHGWKKDGSFSEGKNRKKRGVLRGTVWNVESFFFFSSSSYFSSFLPFDSPHTTSTPTSKADDGAKRSNRRTLNFFPSLCVVQILYNLQSIVSTCL